MRRDDPRFCEGTKTCTNGLDLTNGPRWTSIDEPFDYCQSVVVIGSDQMDGIYKATSASTYKQMGGVNLIHKEGRGWQDDQGSPIHLVKILEERANLEEKAFVFEGGFVCQSAGQGNSWSFIPDDDYRRCDSVTQCGNGFDEEHACKKVNLSSRREGMGGFYIYHNATETYNQINGNH